MAEKRFEIKEYQTNGLLHSFEIIVDKETGVNYLLVKNGYGAGLTPLLDENGKTIITK